MTPFGEGVYWRESQRPAKFGPIDYRAVVFILPLFFYFRWITVFFALIAVAIFVYLGRKQIQPDNILRWLRSYLAGAEIMPHDYDSIRHPVDFGFEDEKLIAKHRALIEKEIELVKQGKRRGSDTMIIPEGKVKSRIQGINKS